MLVNLLASASAVSATVNARGDPTTSDCDELPSVAPVKHDFHSTPGSSGNGAPTLSYDGCYASSWYTGNVMCSDASDDPAMHCPSACQEPAPSPLLAKRVRKGVSKLTTEEFDKVVEAMWIMKRTKTAEGQAKYGKAYREYDFFAYQHLISQFVPFDGVKCMGTIDGEPNCFYGNGANHLSANGTMGIDVTGGGPQQLTWHAAWLTQFETALLLVDPSIGGLPYLDWHNLANKPPEYYAKLVGYPTCTGVVQDGYTPDCFSAPGQTFVTQGSVNSGPWANWPLTLNLRLDEWLAANPDAAEEGWYPVLDPKYDDIRPNSTLGWYTQPHTILRGNTRDNTMKYMGEHGLTQNLKEAFEFCTQALSCDGGMYLEVSGCYENKLEVTSLDLHQSAHIYMLGGDGMGIDGAVHPVSWFHHAGGDWLRSTWQFNNPQLREFAYGYPVISAYNQTNVGLYDAINVDAYGLGFNRAMEGGRSLGNMTAADVLCGLEDLYTYDTIIEAYNERGAASTADSGYTCSADSWRAAHTPPPSPSLPPDEQPDEPDEPVRAVNKGRSSVAIASGIAGIAIGFFALFVARVRGQSNVELRTKLQKMKLEQAPVVLDGYDMQLNDAAKLRVGEHPPRPLGVREV